MRKEVLNFLNSIDISLEEKKKYLNSKKFINFLLSLSVNEILILCDLIFEKELADILGKKFDNIFNSKNFFYAKKINKWRKEIKEYPYFNSNSLNRSFPLSIKRIIANKVYNNIDMIIDTLSNENIDFNIKKLIVDEVIQDRSLAFVLSFIPKGEICDYILDNRVLGKNKVIEMILRSANKDCRLLVINRCVDKKALTYLFDNNLISDIVSNEIVQNKIEETNFYIHNLSFSKALKVVGSDNFPFTMQERVWLEKKNMLILGAIFTPLISNNDFFYQSNPKVIDLYYRTHFFRINSSILFNPLFNPFSWLTSKAVPDSVKLRIMKCRNLEIDFLIKTMSYSSLKQYLYNREYTNLPSFILDKIFKLRKNNIIDNIKKNDKKENILDIQGRDYCQEYLKLLIEYSVNKDNILDLLRSGYRAGYIIHVKKELIYSILDGLTPMELLTFDKYGFNEPVKRIIVDNNIFLFKEKLSLLDKDLLLKSLNNDNILDSIKEIIIEIFGYSRKEALLIKKLFNFCDVKHVLMYYSQIKLFLKKANIDINLLFQYGGESKICPNWLGIIISILENNKEGEFIEIKNYLDNNFYDNLVKENDVSRINSFLEVLANYNKEYSLIIDILKRKISLSENDKITLKYLFKDTNRTNLIFSYDDLENYRKKMYFDVLKKVYSSDIKMEDILYIYNNFLFNGNSDVINYIGGTTSLKNLMVNNKKSKLIRNLIKELIFYSNIIEEVNNSNNYQGLLDYLRKTFSSYDEFVRVQNLFADLKNKVTKLYEYESKVNLSRLDSLSSLEDVLDYKLMKEYGGLVYDFKDKNYVLYAHVLSSKEKIFDLVSGSSDGNKNFISLSPVSYKGQYYYYNSYNTILAYDRIPSGSFIYSSIANMNTNILIRSNSLEVDDTFRKQRGILESSAVVANNSEALFYREGLIPCGIILPGGRIPSNEELLYHKKYNLPFIVTQKVGIAIDNPKKIFDINDLEGEISDMKELENILSDVSSYAKTCKENNIYTGREVAIFTDSHALYEPTLAILEDIRKNGIREIYSLGDNIGSGPNPSEVLDLLDEYEVKSVLGNGEFYQILGTKPFPYLNKDRIENEEWTHDRLSTSQIKRLNLYPASIDLNIGNKKVALCHFGNDIRWDFSLEHNVNYYQRMHNAMLSPIQFLYTNSPSSKKVVDSYALLDKPFYKGYLDAKERPLFEGKTLDNYDSIFEGHAHFEMNDTLGNLDIHTLRAVGLGFDRFDPLDMAVYYVLKERKDGFFDIDKKYVSFNRNYLLSNIMSSSIPHKEKILEFTTHRQLTK